MREGKGGPRMRGRSLGEEPSNEVGGASGLG